MNLIPYGRQSLNDEDIQSVVDVLRSPFLTQGDKVPEFEGLVSRFCNATYATALNSATSALHISCLALGLGEGDMLWTSPNTFVASANCALYCGANVDFVDIDPLTWNMSVEALEQKLINAQKQGKLPKIVIPVHFAGQPTEQEKIWELSQSYGFKIIEDASHSIGATRHGEIVGSCKWSNITVFSFHPVKILTTGEGGMALTNDPLVASKIRLLRTHGITRDSGLMATLNPPPWRYEQQALGFNYRMTDIHAALGASQLSRLESFLAERNMLAQRYFNLLKELPVQLPKVLDGNYSAFHLFVLRLKMPCGVNAHLALHQGLRKKGLGVNLHYEPVYWQPYYQRLGFRMGLCPEAESYAAEAVTIPLFCGLSMEQQDYVVEALRELICK